MSDGEDLEKKPWFRFFKLCYVFTYIALVCGVLLFAYSSFPEGYVNDYESTISCDNGKSYLAGASGIYPLNGSLSDDGDSNATKLCANEISHNQTSDLNYMGYFVQS